MKVMPGKCNVQPNTHSSPSLRPISKYSRNYDFGKMGKTCETTCTGGGSYLPQDHQVLKSGIIKNKYNFRLGTVTSAMPSMQNKFIRAGPLNLSFGLGNFEKVWSEIGQHEIQYME
jgi:hypothetical protein